MGRGLDSEDHGPFPLPTGLARRGPVPLTGSVRRDPPGGHHPAGSLALGTVPDVANAKDSALGNPHVDRPDGRPLGLEVDASDRLIVCDAYKGLMRWSGGAPEVLVDSYRGDRLLLVNNAAIATDGTIYFTDSSRRFDLADYKLDLIEHSGTGRLFAHRPDGETEQLLEGLHFANGVALSADESFLAYAETGLYRMSKLWLTGEKQGRTEVLIDNLPGFPDNVTHHDAVFWVAIVSPRVRILDICAERPWVARIAARLPASLQPAPSRHAAVFGIDYDGEVVDNLQDPEGNYAVITSARVHGEHLYLGSLDDAAVARVQL